MDYSMRAVNPADLEQVCNHRERMFGESGRHNADDLRPMTAAFRDWLRPRLMDGSYFGWVVEFAERPIAGVGMMEIDWPPHPLHPTDARRGYVLNLFVEPDHRHKGLARRLMRLVDDEAGRRKIGYVILHATRQGRPLYEKLGWEPTSEMAVQIR